MTWQPIETAPRDGSRILIRLVFDVDDVRVYGARWDTDTYVKRSRPFWRWDVDVFGLTTMRDRQPTHWQPLPSTEVP